MGKTKNLTIEVTSDYRYWTKNFGNYKAIESWNKKFIKNSIGKILDL